MFTMEQKVDLVMRYIASADKTQQKELKNAILEALNDDDNVQAPAEKYVDVVNTINDIFKEIGVPPHRTGYAYALEAVRMAYCDPTYLKGVTHRLYPEIGAKYNVSYAGAERAIRNTIEATFDYGNMSKIHAIFGDTISVSKGKLTNRAFITYVTNEVRRRMANKEGV